jgi:hypothetical protein
VKNNFLLISLLCLIFFVMGMIVTIPISQWEMVELMTALFYSGVLIILLVAAAGITILALVTVLLLGNELWLYVRALRKSFGKKLDLAPEGPAPKLRLPIFGSIPLDLDYLNTVEASFKEVES